jgi:hypothetical protein
MAQPAQILGSDSIAANVPADGRQSPAALRIARGVRRLFRAMDWASLTELPLASGRRADIVAVTRDGSFVIAEIKSSMADLRADRKWTDYRMHCDRLYFAIDATIPPDALPADAGLILADEFGAEIVRPAPEHRMPAATRRAMLLRFAHGAAHRLHALGDPDIREAFRGR